MNPLGQTVMDLLSEVVAQAQQSHGLSQEKVGPEDRSVQGVWLYPHPSSTMPLFIDESGVGYRASFTGEMITDDQGLHPCIQLQPVFPKLHRQADQVSKEEMLQAVLHYLSDQIRQEEGKENRKLSEALLQRTLALFLSPLDG